MWVYQNQKEFFTEIILSVYSQMVYKLTNNDDDMKSSNIGGVG